MRRLGLWCVVLVTVCVSYAANSGGHSYRTQRRWPERRVNGLRLQVIDEGRTYPRACNESSCYPAVGNLLIGRQKYLWASSTCGQQKKERFCIVSHLKERKKCFVCDSRNVQKSHEVENIVSRIGGNRLKWWQAENGKENVTIQLDLEAEFHFTHLIITFKTFRPAAMLIERSYDFGRTWKVYQYFAYSCADSFPGIPNKPRERVTDVVCDSRYSGVEPSTEGEVIFRVLPPNIEVDDPYSSEIQDLLKITNLRINFTKLHTLGDNLLDQSKQIKMKYYYAVYEMVVRGSCSCYGHANQCAGELGQHTGSDVVYGKCLCTHHTKGINCEQCEDMYNDQPWKPAVGKQTNACKKCTCNGHATRCHFDPAVWESSGKVSGGVCDNCQHNTMGQNCELCKPFYFRDSRLDITHPDVCQPCDCDPYGSEENGICEPHSDSVLGTVAGVCHCKKNVEGRRCDRCKSGFWNLRPDNPDGCEPCSCSLLGIIENHGCNHFTGECACKRNVAGRDCSQCVTEFWGLSVDEVGCKPCDCDPGGAYDYNCDVINGQCRCRPHVIERRCDQSESGYFVGNLDYLTYEAELTRGCQNCQVIVREPKPDRKSTWTGLGFMRVYKGSNLKFNISDIPQTLEYGIIIRYEHQLPKDWKKVIVSIKRLDSTDHSGLCAHIKPSNDKKIIRLSSGKTHVLALPPVCLEKGKMYTIDLKFKYYNRQKFNPQAFVYIDSIVLTPQIDRIPIFQKIFGSERNHDEFKRFHCDEIFFSVSQRKLPEVCKKFLYSIGFYVFDGGLKCDCNPIGSFSEQCDQLGGQCQCKTNVIGRRCDRCATGTYGLDAKGCKACNCHSEGSLDNFCNIETGQCRCHGNTYGQRCDKCPPGFWNFPNCEVCSCNGHSDACDLTSGYCLNCRDFTTGPNCDRCITGYYGDPRIGVQISCRPCSCPDSKFSHARDCELDRENQNVICHCEEGYKGEKCEVCADNFYGDPSVPSEKCHRCKCNDNIDVTVPGSCDPLTGECLLCIFNTEGPNCEYCKHGYYGNATQHNCQMCVCSTLGTHPNSKQCNKTTGQCTCLPNVIGKTCDHCAAGFWNFSSGEGCKPCDCDPQGSLSNDCNVFDGWCHCKKGYGGRTCSDCKDNYWGDPKTKCIPCDCNFEGAATFQCRRNDGTCFCKKGIVGKYCNQCARGYTGKAPKCEHCGECFEQWECKIKDLKNQALTLIEEFNEVNDTGTTGVYTEEFEEMQQKLDETEKLLASENITQLNTSEIEITLQILSLNLTTNEALLENVDSEINGTLQRISDATHTLNDLKVRAGVLEQNVRILEYNVTKLQEADIEGAFSITKEAEKRSSLSEIQVQAARNILDESAKWRNQTEELLKQEKNNFNKTYDENTSILENVSDQISVIESGVGEINRLVCDGVGTVNKCDHVCGGAGCGKCGGISCNNGAITVAKNALDLAEEAQQNIVHKKSAAQNLLTKMKNLRMLADEALNKSKEAVEQTSNFQLESGDISADIMDLLHHVEKFLHAEGLQYEEIQAVSEKCLNLKMPLGPEEIEKLAHEIQESVKNLTNSEDILNAAFQKREEVKELVNRAAIIKKNADAVIQVANIVKVNLEETKESQDHAETAIVKTRGLISTVDRDHKEIENQTQNAKAISDRSLRELEKLKKQSGELQEKYLENKRSLERAVNQAETSRNLTVKAEEDAQLLEKVYKETEKRLSQKEVVSNDVRYRTQELKQKAMKLIELATERYHDFKELEANFNKNNQTLNRYKDILDGLLQESEEIIEGIRKKSTLYRECT
ncbi:laminin subunit beta-1-like isoform X3 [Tachypleus tridentatus]|uniref:laminin subunit beta-1-like isoform X3 n=1 Tax=Tachypleus tridentatus TaxID=6853 RepID=UPI003FD0C6C3